MRAKEFRTRTIYKKRKHVSIEDAWILALDLGYSGVKGFCPNGYFCFPSYAVKLRTERLNIEPEPEEILYRDNKTGEIWLVGAVAQNNTSLEDTKDSESSLYGRNRYFDPMFKVLCAVGIGLGLTVNECGEPEGKAVYIQSGLPPAYIKSDSELLKEVLSGDYDFSLKFGKSGWMDYKLDIPQERVKIMAQPMGTLRSICVDQNGHLIPQARDYMKKTTLIFDPGFGTLDIFPIIGGQLGEVQTFDNLGMKEVLKRTTDKIFNKHRVEIRVPAMQKILEDGRFKKVEKRGPKPKSEYHTFDELLEESNNEVCMEALEQVMKIYNYLSETDYLVVTGGTGAAWNSYILDYLKGMTTPEKPGEPAALTIIPGNKNDEIPYIFANARGYYMSLYAKLKSQK